MGQGYKLVIHRRNTKNGQDLYKLVFNLTLTEEIKISEYTYTQLEGM